MGAAATAARGQRVRGRSGGEADSGQRSWLKAVPATMPDALDRDCPMQQADAPDASGCEPARAGELLGDRGRSRWSDEVATARRACAQPSRVYT
jgi:hypothetical protein